ncbi:MAG: serine/threonine-protein kinase [Pseudomonadota bacterium]
MNSHDQIGPFTLKHLLGKGAHNDVWLAHDARGDCDVAVKFAHEDVAHARLRLQHEAEVGARLYHPNIVFVHEWDEFEGIVCLSMEHVTGQSMQAALEAGQAARLEWIDTLLVALEHAHDAGVVHCDVTPANIMMNSEGTLKLGDFGLARLDGHGTGVAHGTPNYMAPEQMRQRADSRSDLYAVGVILYQLLTGARPFAGSAFQVMQQVLREAPTAPSARAPQHGAAYDELVLRALAKAPDQRYASAAEMRAALARARYEAGGA